MPSGQVVNFRAGDSAGLQFELQLTPLPDSRADSATFGTLRVWLGEDLVWGRFDSSGNVQGVEWYWIELLEHLARHWRYLRYEQGYPFGAMPSHPSKLAATLERRWSRREIDESAEDEVVYGFRNSHDLAVALNGCVVPDLWFVREGRAALIECKGHVRRRPHRVEIATLEELGRFLSLQISQLSDSRSVKARETWERRNEVSVEEMISIGTGESVDDLRSFADGKRIEEVFHDPFAASIEENRAVDLVYRCKGLPAKSLRMLVAELRDHGDPPSPALEELGRSMRVEKESLEERNFPPYVQGHKLALMLRHDLRFFADRTARAEPERFLELLGVSVARRPLDSRRLDAVGVWGRGINPRVFVNAHEKHLKNVGAERATIAHELCHILVDREDVLPLSAVVGGIMDRTAEQRANAFAAEILCPRFYLRGMYEQFLSAADVITHATHRFGVSNELAALQLARAECRLAPDDEAFIEAIVSPEASLPWRPR